MAVAEAKRWLMELFAYDVGEKQRLLRAATARGYGLPGVEFSRPYPGSTNTTVTMQAAPNTDTATPQSPVSSTPAASAPAPSAGPSKTGWLAAGLAALALATGGAVAYTSTRTPAAPPAAASSSPLAPQDYQIDWSIDPSTGEMIVSPPRRLD